MELFIGFVALALGVGWLAVRGYQQWTGRAARGLPTRRPPAHSPAQQPPGPELPLSGHLGSSKAVIELYRSGALDLDDDPVHRYRAEFDRIAAAAPAPPDPVVAELVERVRTHYKLGSGRYDELVPRLREELIAAGPAGEAAAQWIVRTSLADFRWELGYWQQAEGGGRDPQEPVFHAYSRLPWEAQRRVNPFHAVSGFHPVIHLPAAVQVVTGRPVPELVETLDLLLEHWLAWAQVNEPKPADLLLLTSLAECRRVTAATAGPRRVPAYLSDLARGSVTQQVTGWDYIEAPGGAVNQVLLNAGSIDLSALARQAIG